MKIKAAKKAVILFAFLGLMTTLTSCNRGYGCPTWSVNETATEIVTDAVQSIVNFVE